MNELISVAGGRFLMGRGLSDVEILLLPRLRKIRDGVDQYLAKPGAPIPPQMTDVHVGTFWIGRCPVTQAEWEEITGANPSRFKDPARPVECVTWADAVAYCNQRSLRDGLKPCYVQINGLYQCDFAASGYRLPTEAEWEYAARGGQLSRGYIFPGGDDVNQVAWHAGNAGNQTHPVGEKAPNELGLFDLAGNVWEFCWDWYHSNAIPEADNPTGPAKPGSERARVVRGGCYKNSPHLLYTGRRLGRGMLGRNDHLGFRIVRTGV
ncbi:MAG TPA: formylglycine-generating enzyme family protein [Symbiobacteriaceae bacterium]|nr:formylglycine-generating enzyme family protein [Symbiobacteriaceae bacterium]